MGWMITTSKIHYFPSVVLPIARIIPLTTFNRRHLPASTSRHSIPRLLLLHSKARQRKVISLIAFSWHKISFEGAVIDGVSAAEAKLQRAAEHFIPSSSESDDSGDDSDEETERAGGKQSMEDRGGASRPAAMHEHRGKEKRKRDKCVPPAYSFRPSAGAVHNWRGLR